MDKRIPFEYSFSTIDQNYCSSANSRERKGLYCRPPLGDGQYPHGGKFKAPAFGWGCLHPAEHRAVFEQAMVWLGQTFENPQRSVKGLSAPFGMTIRSA
jgi:hypothetical protein